MNQRIHERHVTADGGASYGVLYASVPGKGSVMLEVCASCSYVQSTCEHAQRRWREDSEGDTVLMCRLCNIDCS